MPEGTLAAALTSGLEVEARPHVRMAPAWDYAAVALVYGLLMALTVPFFMGDTIGYAQAILERRFTDFGHFGWYLLGFVVSEALLPFTRLFVGPSEHLNITFTLVAINIATGLLSVLLMYSLVYQLTKARAAAYLATAGLMVSDAFLDFTQSGCSYTAGMAFLLLGIWLLACRQDTPATGRTPLAAGAALFAAVAVWFPYVFAVPAALLAPVVLHGANVRRLKLIAATATVLSVLALVTFGIGAYANGARSLEGVKAWIDMAAHGVRGMQGVPRMVFGLGRSFISTGNDGPMVKAYLAGDPYNPVSLTDLVRISLWKLAVIYVFIASMVVWLLTRRQGRRALTLLAVTAIPVLGFAILWQGNAIERYVPMFPAFFLAFGVALAMRESPKAVTAAGAAFVALLAVVNVTAMAAPVQNSRERAVSERIRELEPLLREGSIVATVTQMDEVWAFAWTFPFNRINASGRLGAYHIIEPGTEQTMHWRELFAATAIDAWKREADVWVSRRVLAERPLRSWKWVEHDDPFVSWKDVPNFFASLEMEHAVGGDDGFMRLARTPANSTRLLELASRLPAPD